MDLSFRTLFIIIQVVIHQLILIIVAIRLIFIRIPIITIKVVVSRIIQIAIIRVVILMGVEAATQHIIHYYEKWITTNNKSVEISATTVLWTLHIITLILIAWILTLTIIHHQIYPTSLLTEIALWKGLSKNEFIISKLCNHFI